MAETNIDKVTWSQAMSLVLVMLNESGFDEAKTYGVPRGGSVVSALCGNPVDSPEAADLIVDDIIDSGRTRDKYRGMYPEKPFLALIDKTKDSEAARRWVQFPWEPEAKQDIEEAIVRQIEFIGEDAAREGLVQTPARVVRSWDKIYGGYRIDPASVFTTFKDGACDEMVILKNIEFFSTCEHHLLPFFGRISVGYIPRDRVIGVSKLSRLVEVFSRRLQIQERLTSQITESLMTNLNPLGAMAVCEAKHLCMIARGTEKKNAEMVTSSCLGLFRDDIKARSEFLNLIKP